MSSVHFLIAAADVHTSGVNLESVTIIIGTMCATIIAVATFIVARIDRGRDRTEKFFAKQLEAVVESFNSQTLAISTAIGGRMDRVEGHLASQDALTTNLVLQVGRLQGNLEGRTGLQGAPGVRGERGVTGDRGPDGT